MTNKTLKWLFISLLLVTLPVVLGTRGYKKKLSEGSLMVYVFVESPAVETFETIYHFIDPAIAKSIFCQCRGSSTPTATMAWDLDDGSPISVDAGTIVCDNEEEDLVLTGDTNFDAGDDLDLRITAIGGNVTDCSFLIYFD